MLDRNSRERSAEGVRSLTLHEALAFASAVESRAGEAVGPGEVVSVAAVNLDRDAGNSGLYWDNEARAVTFAYEARGGPRTVWLENRYSAAFRLDLASRYGLGGGGGHRRSRRSQPPRPLGRGAELRRGRRGTPPAAVRRVPAPAVDEVGRADRGAQAASWCGVRRSAPARTT